MPKKSMSAARVTTDHETIRHWVEERDGGPATVRRTSRRGDPGILRIDFPGYLGEETLEPISWDEFFVKFDESGLAFLYQEETANGGTSRFSKFLKRDDIFAGDHPVKLQRKPQGSVESRTDGGRRARPRQATRATAKRGPQRATARAATAGPKPTTARPGPQKAAGASGGRLANGRQSTSPRPRKSR
jgi:hypothetical protein